MGHKINLLYRNHFIYLNPLERFMVAITRLNGALDNKGIAKKITIRNLEITFTWNSKKNLWGRFGGGWNWKLGFMASGRTIIFSLLICDIRFYLKRRKSNVETKKET